MSIRFRSSGVREQRLREQNHIGAWQLDAGPFLVLGGEHADQTELLEGGRHVLNRDETPYDEEAMFNQQFYDLYAVDARSGRESRVRERLTLGAEGSPGGRYVVWFEGEDYWSHDLSDGETRNITEGLDGQFVNLDLTPTREQMPPFGVAGWMEEDEAVLINDRYDVWEVSPDGSGGQRLTRGAEGEVRHRVARVDPDADALDPDEPVYFSTYSQWTKQAGFSRMRPGRDIEPLVVEDAAFAGPLRKAPEADVFVFRRERFDDSPDYFAAGPDLDDARQVTRTNPFQDDFAWGRTELIEYENEWGRRLQGALTYPAGYEPGRQYPMIVYHYELLSQTLHQYQVPDPTRYYNIQIWSQEGYFVLRPDIVYRDRRPGQSNVETLRPAVAAVLERGQVDAERIGLIGHSWGGYQTTFFVTQDDLFASAVAGAPLTNLMSMYLSFYWNSGGTDARIFEISQGRMQVPWWEDWDSYFNNSPLHHIQNLNTPLLMEFGTEDGAVEFNQGVEFYNAAPGREADGAPRLRWGEPRVGPGRQPTGLSEPHSRVVRPLPQGRAGPRLDHEGGPVPGAEGRAETEEEGREPGVDAGDGRDLGPRRLGQAGSGGARAAPGAGARLPPRPASAFAARPLVRPDGAAGRAARPRRRRSPGDRGSGDARGGGHRSGPHGRAARSAAGPRADFPGDSPARHRALRFPLVG